MAEVCVTPDEDLWQVRLNRPRDGVRWPERCEHWRGIDVAGLLNGLFGSAKQEQAIVDDRTADKGARKRLSIIRILGAGQSGGGGRRIPFAVLIEVVRA